MDTNDMGSRTRPGRRPGPLPVSAIRNLASVSSVYRAVLNGALALVEEAEVNNTTTLVAYGRLAEHLRAALAEGTVGSIPSILRNWAVLLGEEPTT